MELLDRIHAWPLFGESDLRKVLDGINLNTSGFVSGVLGSVRAEA